MTPPINYLTTLESLVVTIDGKLYTVLRAENIQPGKGSKGVRKLVRRPAEAFCRRILDAGKREDHAHRAAGRGAVRPVGRLIEGGAPAVENGMKTAFDWKVRLNLSRGSGERGCCLPRRRCCWRQLRAPHPTQCG